MNDASPDALVIGSGPSALAIATALCKEGVKVHGLSNKEPNEPWPYTYGIWGKEVDELGMEHLLEHRWRNTVSYFGEGSNQKNSQHNNATEHNIEYGLFNKIKLQEYWLNQCEEYNLVWHKGHAKDALVGDKHTTIKTREGFTLKARLVIDASGYDPVFIKNKSEGDIAIQTCYGVVGKFNSPPVESGQFVLMDYRCNHLSNKEREEPPTFLYAMDMGGGSYFLEETSLGLSPPVELETLRKRLSMRLKSRGLEITDLEHEELGIYLPMNMPLPNMNQGIFGFGGAASMVHPASGYMFGGLLRRAPGVAKIIADKMNNLEATPHEISKAAWNELWPAEMVRKQALYKFGLEKLMRFSEDQLRDFFKGFFTLPTEQWYGFLTNKLDVNELIKAMVKMFIIATWNVRWGLMIMKGREFNLLWNFLKRY
ncbi:lycopene beta cyclase [Prochlorococcus sp. MIT 1341]|uniref:lycopene beta cyclase n=1 Tax=Prochlorococcus sp. MIT 1341 TaxID=3096221 RepID=UPI002A754E8F|nr:lycopene cyclase family protein [Prochlorococcus sp. MIT 1341]